MEVQQIENTRWANIINGYRSMGYSVRGFEVWGYESLEVCLQVGGTLAYMYFDELGVCVGRDICYIGGYQG